MKNIRKILRENIEEFNFNDFGIVEEEQPKPMKCNPSNCQCKKEDEYGKIECKCAPGDKCQEVYMMMKPTKVSGMVPATPELAGALEESLKRKINKLK